jgi:hypothetical protein
MTTIRSSGLLLVVFLTSGATAGCMLRSNNGDVESGPVGSVSLAPFGYYPSTTVTVDVQVLSNSAADPTVDGNWSTVTQATPSGPAYYFFPGDQGTSPLYQWDAPTITPFGSSSWQQGGVARIRATNGSNTLRIFDSNWLSCPNTANTYEEFGNQCGSYTDYAVLVSPTPTPADNPAPPAGRWLEGVGTDPTPAQTQAYYNLIGAGPSGPFATLTQFKSHFGFPVGETAAAYYNNGDLGIGRQMHCKVSGSATACYVSNYADFDAQSKPIFGGTPSQQQDAITLAVANGPPVATVAMIYDPTQPSGQTVKFIVYQPNNQPQLTAALDNHSVHGEPGSSTAIPTNCMACHGGSGSYDPGANLVQNAHFLAFDPYSYVYSATDSTRSQSAMAPTFQALNEMVYNAGATNTTKAFLQALYNSASDPNSGTGAVAGAVPSGWSGNWNEKQLYTNVVAPYCRTCHSSRDDAFSWSTYEGFSALQSDILLQTCVAQDMPHAEQAQRNFWGSGARAHLLAWAGATGACTPQ